MQSDFAYQLITGRNANPQREKNALLGSLLLQDFLFEVSPPKHGPWLRHCPFLRASVLISWSLSPLKNKRGDDYSLYHQAVGLRDVVHTKALCKEQKLMQLLEVNVFKGELRSFSCWKHKTKACNSREPSGKKGLLSFRVGGA